MMGFHLHLTLGLDCNECGMPLEPEEEHVASGCKWASRERALKSLYAHRLQGRCRMEDCGGTVEENMEGWWECRKCNTQYSASHFAGGEDPDDLESVVLVLSNDSWQKVLVKTVKGEGDFKYDRARERIRRAYPEYEDDDEDRS